MTETDDNDSSTKCTVPLTAAHRLFSAITEIFLLYTISLFHIAADDRPL